MAVKGSPGRVFCMVLLAYLVAGRVALSIASDLKVSEVVIDQRGACMLQDGACDVSAFEPDAQPQVSWLWIIEDVDLASSCFDMDVGMVLGSDSVPHVSYYDNDNQVLKYARGAASGWRRTVVDDSERVGRSSAIALDSAGNPHIGYRDMKGNNLKYAFWDGTAWRVELIGNNEYGWSPSLALDSADHAHMAYLGAHPGSGSQTPKYATWNGSEWEIDVIDPVFTSGGTSIALDSLDRPHVSYQDAGALQYAVHSGAKWTIETVDSKQMNGFPVGLYSAIALDNMDNPQISYALYGQDFSPPWPEDLKFAWSQDGKWETYVPDAQGQVGFFSALGLDARNNTHISYYDSGRQALKHAFWDGDVWTLSVVDSPVYMDGATALDVDQDGQPHIVYCDGHSSAIQYARGILLAHRAFLPWLAR
jgi:hypothetical protein